uniref:Uncharacterized protein n=1 Tax=Aegilops tauschii subsp. strangulata TaxID=200361 RepID=A0A453IJP6_AEGTS
RAHSVPHSRPPFSIARASNALFNHPLPPSPPFRSQSRLQSLRPPSPPPLPQTQNPSARIPPTPGSPVTTTHGVHVPGDARGGRAQALHAPAVQHQA